MTPQETKDNLVLYACFWEATIPVLIWLYVATKLHWFTEIPQLIMIGAFGISLLIMIDGVRNYTKYKKMIEKRS